MPNSTRARFSRCPFPGQRYWPKERKTPKAGRGEHTHHAHTHHTNAQPHTHTQTHKNAFSVYRGYNAEQAAAITGEPAKVKILDYEKAEWFRTPICQVRYPEVGLYPACTAESIKAEEDRFKLKYELEQKLEAKEPVRPGSFVFLKIKESPGCPLTLALVTGVALSDENKKKKQPAAGSTDPNDTLKVITTHTHTHTHARAHAHTRRSSISTQRRRTTRAFSGQL